MSNIWRRTWHQLSNMWRRPLDAADVAQLTLLPLALVAVGTAVLLEVLLVYQARYWTAVVVFVTLLLMVIAAITVGHGHGVLLTIDTQIRSASSDKLAGILIALVPLVVVLLNLTVRGSYSAFYTPLHVLPEEIGFDSQMLLQLSGALFLFMIAGYLMLFAWFTSIVLWWRRQVKKSATVEHASALSLVLISLFFLALLGVGAVHLRSEAGDEAAEVARGNAVHPIDVGGMTVVGIRAEGVTVYWSSKAPTGFQSINGPCLYLGQANGTLVLYEVDGGQVSRVPSNAVVLRSSSGGASCFVGLSG